MDNQMMNDILERLNSIFIDSIRFDKVIREYLDTFVKHLDAMDGLFMSQGEFISTKPYQHRLHYISHIIDDDTLSSMYQFENDYYYVYRVKPNTIVIFHVMSVQDQLYLNPQISGLIISTFQKVNELFFNQEQVELRKNKADIFKNNRLAIIGGNEIQNQEISPLFERIGMDVHLIMNQFDYQQSTFKNKFDYIVILGDLSTLSKEFIFTWKSLLGHHQSKVIAIYEDQDINKVNYFDMGVDFAFFNAVSVHEVMSNLSMGYQLG